MTAEEIRATLTICLLASFADGEKHDREREQIRQVAESLAGDQHINLPGLYQDVLLRRVYIVQQTRALLGLRLFECGIPLRGRQLHGLIDFRWVSTVITATMMGHDSLIWLGQSLQ